MGQVQGTGYNPRTGRVWCTLFAIADNNTTSDEISYVLNVPSGRDYETHTWVIDSENRKYGVEANYANRQLRCRVWAQYTSASTGGPRSWIRAIFYLETLSEETKDFLREIDPKREEFTRDLNDPSGDEGDPEAQG